MHYASWCCLSNAGLARRDIAEVNLAAAYDCPHAVDLDVKGLCRNLFIHGLLTGHGGTCCTMPVLCAAIGRRLGYPIKLVSANGAALLLTGRPCEGAVLDRGDKALIPRHTAIELSSSVCGGPALQ